MKYPSSFIFFFFTAFLLLQSFSLRSESYAGGTEVNWPEFVMAGYAYQLDVTTAEAADITVKINGKTENTASGTTSLSTLVNLNQVSDIEVFINGEKLDKRSYRPIPLWFSILPPLLTIVLALIIREVIVSLFIGIFIGTLIPGLYAFGIAGFFPSMLRVVDTYVVKALYDTGHISVILFSLLIGATVSIVSKNGGMHGVVNRLTVYAHNRRSGQLVTWFLGVAIFFDDYANSLIVGTTMRPVTDKLKISREKLSYLVDSTAAPVAAIALVTTWIGAELGYIQEGLNGIAGLDMNVYQIFLNSLQYAYYPIFTIIFMFMLIWMKRDFGPMLHAERRCVSSGESSHELVNVSDKDLQYFDPAENIPKRSFNAVIPITAIVVVTIGGLFYTGWDSAVWTDPTLTFVKKLSETIGRADAYKALLWSSLTGLMLAILLSLSQRLMTLEDTMTSVANGFKTMLGAVIILVLAWSLSAVTADLHTATFLTNSISGVISPYALPLVTFLTAAVISFSTGTSWGTMAILYPMILPLTWAVGMGQGLEEAGILALMYNVVSCVLAGAVFGDHCSPISDTTILSSLASSCNHIEHVRTQLPYALSTAVIALVFGTIPASFGLPFYLCMALGIGAMYLLIRKAGKEI